MLTRDELRDTGQARDRRAGMPRRSPALILIHVVWATARRARLLHPSFDPMLIALMGAKARELDCALIVGGCAPDHVHTVFDLAASVPLADLVQRVKGASAHEMNRTWPPGRLVRWQAGYWAESLGPADLDELGDYVVSQRVRHDGSHPSERWQFGDEREPAREGGL